MFYKNFFLLIKKKTSKIKRNVRIMIKFNLLLSDKPLNIKIMLCNKKKINILFNNLKIY